MRVSYPQKTVRLATATGSVGGKMFKFKVLYKGKVQFFPLEIGKLRIGSAKECEICFSDIPSQLATFTVSKKGVSFQTPAKVQLIHNGKKKSNGKIKPSDTLTYKELTMLLVAVEEDDHGQTMLVDTSAFNKAHEMNIEQKIASLKTEKISNLDDDKTVFIKDASKSVQIPTDFLEETKVAISLIRESASADQITQHSLHFDETERVPAAILNILKGQMEDIGGGSIDEIKAALNVNQELRQKLQNIISPSKAARGASSTINTPPSAQNTQVSSTTARKASQDFKSIVEKEVHASETIKTKMGREKSQSLLKALENMGVHQEDIRKRAMSYITTEEGLSTAEVLVQLGLITEDDIDVKPTKQLSGTRPQLEGKVLGDYKLVKELGAGGFGVVYKAISLIDNSTYAIKVLFKEFSDDITQIAIFARESKTAKQFDHENILSVTGLERFRETYYMVTEFVDGGDLSDLIRKEGHLDWKNAAKIGSSICNALSYAADPPGTLRGIIHRDIKPQNILLTKEGTPKIADFGLAKFEEGTSETQVYETTDAMVFKGTVSYAAPERFQGNKDVDQRSDIYSIGVMFYEMLTGRLPFQGKNVSELILSHINEKPIPPRIYNPDIPLAFENLILKCLRKKPEQRHDNAGLIADELDAMLAKGDATTSFSIAAAISSFKMAGTVSIPDTLPSNLPLRVRLKYLLLKPRPKLYKTLGFGSLALAIILAVIIFVPIILENRSISQATNLLAEFKYEPAIEILQAVVDRNPNNVEALKALKKAEGDSARLNETLLPRIRTEKNNETLFTLSSEAFSLNPFDEEICKLMVNSAINAAVERMERGEFNAAIELFENTKSKINSAAPELRESLNSLITTSLENRDPSTSQFQFNKNKNSIIKLKENLKSTEDLFEGSGKEIRVRLAKLDSILTTLDKLLTLYKRLEEIAPRNVDSLIGKRAFQKLRSVFGKCVELEHSGIDVRLQRLLAMLKIEDEINENNVTVLASILEQWKKATPFDEILRTAQGFSQPQDLERASIAIQLCQIVLNIDPTEKRAGKILSDLTTKLIDSIDVNTPSQARLKLARESLFAEAAYSKTAGINAAKLAGKIQEIMRKNKNEEAFYLMWNFSTVIFDKFASSTEFNSSVPLSSLNEFRQIILPAMAKYVAEGKVTGLENHLDLLFTRNGIDEAAAEFVSSIHSAALKSLTKHPTACISLLKKLVQGAKNGNPGNFRASLAKHIDKLQELISAVTIYNKAVADLSMEGISIDKMNEISRILKKLKTDGFAHPQLASKIAEVASAIDDFANYARIKQLRPKLFEAIAKKDYPSVVSTCDEIITSLAANKAVEYTTIKSIIETYIATRDLETATALQKLKDISTKSGALNFSKASEAQIWDSFTQELSNVIIAIEKKINEQNSRAALLNKAKQMVVEADKLFSQKKYLEALALYNKAKGLALIDGLAEKILACNKMLSYQSIFDKGMEAFNSGKYEEALGLFENARLSSNTRAVRAIIARTKKLIVFTKHYEAGKKAMAERNFLKAEQDFTIALQNAPKDRVKELKALLNSAKVQRRLLLAVAALDKEQYRTARDQFAEVLKLEDNPIARAGIGIAILEITNLKDVKETELIDPQTRESIFFKAFAHFEHFRELTKGDSEQAKAVKKAWGVKVARFESISNYMIYKFEHSEKHLLRALEIIDNAIAEFPNDEECLEIKAAILIWLKKPDEASVLIQKALKNKPNSAILHRHLAGIHLAQGKVAEAEAEYKKSLDLDDQDPLTYLGLGNIYKATGRLVEAERAILNAIKVSPLLPEAHNNLAWLYATSTDKKFIKPLKALEHAETANRLTGFRNPDWLDTLAHAYAANSDYVRAVQVEEQALALAPDRSDLKKALAKFKALLKK